jgi:2-aminomuconate deaminase
MGTIKKFEDLEIWQLSRVLSADIYELSNLKPLAQDFALKNQMLRSAGSIMDNIAEGFGRGSRLEFIQFLSIAKASASELQSQIIRCKDYKYISNDIFELTNEKVIKIGNKIAAFIRYLNKSNFKGQKFMERSSENKNQSTTSYAKSQTSEATKLQTQNTEHQTNNTKHQTPNKIIKTTNAATPLGAYPHARKVGNLLFLSGIGSRSAADNSIPGLELDANGNIVKYDIEAECHSVFANVKAVLEASGSSWDKMVDVTVFLTNMKKDFPTYNKIYGEYFKGVEACRTTVEVKSLPTPICIELKVIATLE